ncbi:MULTISPECIES: hypothetical protein [Pseudomonas]|uniref:hypothetical protein n=1 Tax=Pseudomonas TaxID=286 RepID=UPI0006D3F784|nr:MULTISPECIES: hypothetical protein [Pseudomonas]PNB53630.1 hypothetical protein C1X73_30495 [Pseudomonas sp. FW305-130]MBP2081794.1 hypothetical protein [Pseudomonas sp. PvP089]MBP2086589.1 hypothetical protein [Pseudomonas sp. PvP088]MBP2221250.1 hypothetical protein [Pseudomonas putida]MEC4879331.1 hypothetical protein [Pseudomonas sp. NC26]
MKRNLDSMLMPDSPAVQEAVEAMKRYHQAQDTGEPDCEVERLRLAAEQLFQSISDYQLAALGHQPLVRH